MPDISFLSKPGLEREPIHGALIAFLIFTVFALTACGGGGGGGSVGASGTTLATDAQARSFQTAATALPKFGSVTQSSNVDSGGSTTDRASVDFDGTTAKITVTREDGTTFTFVSSDPEWHPDDIDPTRQFVLPGQTDVRFSYHVHEASEDLFFASYIERGWGDSGNWYVGGYWIRGDSNPYVHKAEVELGAYLDSPEIDSASLPTLPIAGSATYSGGAQGVYYHDYANGVREIGQYIGDMTLNVDFATGQLDYCTGCTRPTLLYGHSVSADGETIKRFEEVPNELIYRATAVVGVNGRFETQSTELTRTADSERSPVVYNKGTLGGVFSNIPDADGNPRAIMGTGGGEYEYENGSGGAWVGSYIGTTK